MRSALEQLGPHAPGALDLLLLAPRGDRAVIAREQHRWHVEESHEDGLLEYPSYTKPAAWRGLDVPPVLLSGNHGAIAAWRHEQQVERTRRVRPELLDG